MKRIILLLAFLFIMPSFSAAEGIGIGETNRTYLTYNVTEWDNDVKVRDIFILEDPHITNGYILEATLQLDWNRTWTKQQLKEFGTYPVSKAKKGKEFKFYQNKNIAKIELEIVVPEVVGKTKLSLKKVMTNITNLIKEKINNVLYVNEITIEELKSELEKIGEGTCNKFIL